MRSLFLSTVVLAFIAAEGLPAGEECCQAKLAKTSAQVGELLASWQALAKAEKEMCPDVKAQLDGELASLAKGCPVGSRMGATLGFVRESLAAARAEEKACSQSCAAKGEGTAGTKADVKADVKADAKAAVATTANAESASCPIAQAMATRSKLLGELSELASYAACATGGATACCAEKGEKVASLAQGEKECAKEKGEAALQGVAKTAAPGPAATPVSLKACSKECSKECAEKCAKTGGAVALEAGKGPCPVGVAKGLEARSQEILASWAKAETEAAGFCPVKKGELQASFASLAQRSKSVALLPPTVLALADGLAALEAIDTHVAQFAKANPEKTKDVPEAVKASFERGAGLVRNANAVLSKATCAMKAASGECAEKAKEEQVSAN
jgi:hypothetical protein